MLTIRERKHSAGKSQVLDTIYNGVRHRVTLGQNLTQDEVSRRAFEAWSKIKQEAQPSAVSGSGVEETLEQFLPTYWKAFQVQGHIHRHVPECILENHILPLFGSRPLTSLRPEDGLDYVAKRQSDGAAASTIQREWGLLMRILNLAVQFERLDKNRLKFTPRPTPATRERLPERSELQVLRDKGGNPDVWRMTVAGCLVGLRETKILTATLGQIKEDQDGYWFFPEPGLSVKKLVPKMVPLSQMAHEALTRGAKDGKCFPWSSQAAFINCYARTCQKAHVTDLHFHDLRHWFSTSLEGIGVDYQYRQRLLGHAVRGTTGKVYSHWTPEVAAKCREASNKLEAHWWKSIDLSLDVSLNS